MLPFKKSNYGSYVDYYNNGELDLGLGSLATVSLVEYADESESTGGWVLAKISVQTPTSTRYYRRADLSFA